VTEHGAVGVQHRGRGTRCGRGGAERGIGVAVRNRDEWTRRSVGGAGQRIAGESVAEPGVSGVQRRDEGTRDGEGGAGRGILYFDDDI
jgi:hypothetical protein